MLPTLQPHRVDVFDRIVCGVDPSDAGVDAFRVAGRLAMPDGSLVLVTVNDSSIAVHAGWLMAKVLEQLATEAKRVSDDAQAVAGPIHAAQTRLLEGDPLQCLASEIARINATLAVVGTHGHTRAVGIALGSVATHLLHEAPCSVLVARSPQALGQWPRTIVVGVDGSPGSAAALAAATELGSRFGAHVRPVVSTRGHGVDLEEARRLTPDLEERDEPVVEDLHVLSEFADLVVVGSRGLRGIHALGSVSERFAHDAQCSVLVVRAATP